MGYELVFLDLDGTVLDFARAEREALAGLFSGHGLALDGRTKEAYERVNRALWAALERGETTIGELKVERFRRLFAETGIGEDAERWSADYIDRLSRGIFPIEGAEETCAYLAGKYRLVAISNGIAAVQRLRVANSFLARHVDLLIVSEEAGCAKPDPAIFEYASREAGFHDKARMVMVGDSLASDIQGAVNFGIDSCWTNLEGARPAPGIVPTCEVRTLAELREIL